MNYIGSVFTGSCYCSVFKERIRRNGSKRTCVPLLPNFSIMKKGPLSIAAENIYVVLLDEVQLMGQLFLKWNIFLTRRRQRKEKYESKTESVSTKNNENIFARGNRKKNIIKKGKKHSKG